VFYAVYDPASRILTYANAGHCRPMLVRAGSLRRLDSLAPPVGLLPSLPNLQDSIQLLPGDWLLIFSDGIVEEVCEHAR
jgi:sigma-B regulation protein RsbU (phosphoserine phosphatase)